MVQTYLQTYFLIEINELKALLLLDLLPIHADFIQRYELQKVHCVDKLIYFSNTFTVFKLFVGWYLRYFFPNYITLYTGALGLIMHK